jgi:Cytochrome c554 and c-prime
MAQQQPNSTAGKYVGPGSCSATACHGGIRPMPNSRILQNEYSTWVLQDKHAQAYKALETPVAQRMAKIMGLESATSAPRCLACHALSVSQEKRGREFDVSEGVTCENCHGPASGWLGQHTLKNWTHAQSVALGMHDLPNLENRTEQCLTCHMGTAEKNVDHELIAAGHPDLVFELDSYQVVMPMHWKKPDDPAMGIRTWSVGQAVKLRQALLRLSRRAEGPVWPEFAEMECFACHHDLTKADKSWRQERGYQNRRPGNPPWNAAHYAVLRVVLKSVDPGLAVQLDKDFGEVYALASRINPDRKELAQRANKAAGTADQVAEKLNSMPVDREKASRMMAAIVANSDELAAQGTRTAEQAAMAIEALTAAEGRSNQADVKSAVDALFRQLDNPSQYNGYNFAAQLKRVSGVVGGATAAGN